VLCTDPYVKDSRLVPLEQVLDEAEIFVVGVPHNNYRSLSFGDREVVDVWGALGKGIHV
jgi:UDP-N-acetyl-D-mannosaminuronic acid dehydrogenase